MPKGLPAISAEGEGGLFLLEAGRLHDRDQFARDERERDENCGQDNAGQGKDDSDLVRIEPFPEEALQAKENYEHQTCHDRRNGERQIDECNQSRLAREFELRDRPRCRQTEEDIQWHTDCRHDQGQADRRPRPRRGPTS